MSTIPRNASPRSPIEPEHDVINVNSMGESDYEDNEMEPTVFQYPSHVAPPK